MVLNHERRFYFHPYCVCGTVYWDDGKPSLMDECVEHWTKVFFGYLKPMHMLSYYLLFFYPTALKGCWGIVFNHSVRMGGRREKLVWAISQKP